MKEQREDGIYEILLGLIANSNDISRSQSDWLISQAARTGQNKYETDNVVIVRLTGRKRQQLNQITNESYPSRRGGLRLVGIRTGVTSSGILKITKQGVFDENSEKIHNIINCYQIFKNNNIKPKIRNYLQWCLFF